MGIDSREASPALRRFSALVCASTLLLLVVGSLVTTTASGDAVPHWWFLPISFGSLLPPMTGGVLYEHGHRLVAFAVGILVAVLAAWIVLRHPSAGVRRLALAAVAAVVLQGVLGGARVLLRDAQAPIGWTIAVAVVHACVAHAFFALTVVLAMACRAGAPARRDPRFSALAAATAFAAFLQIALGALARHALAPWAGTARAAHLAAGIGLLALGALVASEAWRRRAAAPALARGAALLVGLLIAQVALGLGAYAVMGGGFVRSTAAPAAPVLVITAHHALGALILALAAAIALRAGAGLGFAADLVALCKPRITAVVGLTAFAGFALASGPAVDLGLLAAALAGVTLAAAGTSALNMVIERDPDARMARTAGRPIPAGRIPAGLAAAFGLSLAAGGVAILAIRVNALSAALTALSFALYLFAYTPLKRRTALSTVVGAIPGALPPAIGWAAVRGSLDVEAGLLFSIQFLWQLPHFLAIAWRHRADFERAGFPTLATADPEGGLAGRQVVLQTLALIAVSLFPALLGLASIAYAGGALALGAGFLLFGARFAARPTDERARGLFLASLAYLPLLLGFLNLSRLT